MGKKKVPACPDCRKPKVLCKCSPPKKTRRGGKTPIERNLGRGTVGSGKEHQSFHDNRYQAKKKAEANNIKLTFPLFYTKGPKKGQCKIHYQLREDCKYDFKKFCEEYMSESFYEEWSDDHLIVIKKIEKVILSGGKFAVAMPRGQGKTTLCRAAMVWAICYGHKKYLYFIGANDEMARDSLRSVKLTFETNDTLLRDFPEVCYPARCTGGSGDRATIGQNFDGFPTRLKWSSDELNFACLVMTEDYASHFPDAYEYKIVDPDEVDIDTTGGFWTTPSSGTIVKTKGITGGVRGALAKHPLTGADFRPDVFLADDVQSDKGAESPSTVRKIIKTLEGAVSGLAGPGKVISGIMPCTVIEPGDVSDTFLDNEVKPDWKGERCSMVVEWGDGITDDDISPETDTGKHWLSYDKIRKQSLREHGDIRDATEYYRIHQEIMDYGFKMSWDSRYIKDKAAGGNIELSAKQHAMNLRFTNPLTFFAEFQNNPKRISNTGTEIVTKTYVSSHTTEYKKGEIPSECIYLTSFVDIQVESLWYATVAWTQNYSGYIIDYDCFPQTGRRYVTKSQTEQISLLTGEYMKANKGKNIKLYSLASGQKRAPIEGKIYWAIETLMKKLLVQYQKTDGSIIEHTALAIDTNWEKSKDAIYRWIAQSGNLRLFPSYGHGVTASDTPWIELPPKENELREDTRHLGIGRCHWRIPAVKPVMVKTKDGIEEYVRGTHINYNTNFWKTNLMTRLTTPIGEHGSLTLYSGTPEDHEMFADHIAGSEFPEEQTMKGRTIEVWEEVPNRDNEFLDCMAGNCMLASLAGARIDDEVSDFRQDQKVHVRTYAEEYYRRKQRG
jgi:hypothetical protein